MTSRWRMLLAVAVLAVAGFASACEPPGSRPPDLKTFTDSFAFRVTWAPFPPYAREPILFRVVVRDKKTGAPIERGEGRIFAMSADGIKTFDSFIPAPEPGTYTARLHFITAGEWPVGIQFRKDSLSRLQRPETDFRLTIHNERQ